MRWPETSPSFSAMPGTYTIDGVTVESSVGGAFPDVPFPVDDGFPWDGSPPHVAPLHGLLAPAGLAAGTRLVAYLEAWERHVTAVEDPGIREGRSAPATRREDRVARPDQARDNHGRATAPAGRARAVFAQRFRVLEPAG